MDVTQLQYIIKIAEENNITKAAEKLFMSQSALNQQLLKLEKELGTQLFHRSRANWGLTDAGRIYVEGAKAVLQIDPVHLLLGGSASYKLQHIADGGHFCPFEFQ